MRAIHLFLVVALLVLAVGAFASEATAESRPESVSGHAEFVNPISGSLTRYSVNAVRHRDGSVSGEFETRIETASGDFLLSAHVTIVCFTVTGNIARVGGVVDHSRGAAGLPGSEGFITVVDNGQGPNDPPDLASPSFVGGPGTAATHCTVGLSQPLFAVEHGNIEIRPSGL